MDPMTASLSPLTITPEAAEKLRGEADFSRAVLSVRHLVGCGGAGFRISVEQGGEEEGQPGDRLRSPQVAAFSPSCPFARASERTAQQRSDG